jgi:hypothetical protein
MHACMRVCVGGMPVHVHARWSPVLPGRACASGRRGDAAAHGNDETGARRVSPSLTGGLHVRLSGPRWVGLSPIAGKAKPSGAPLVTRVGCARGDGTRYARTHAHARTHARTYSNNKALRGQVGRASRQQHTRFWRAGTSNDTELGKLKKHWRCQRAGSCTRGCGAQQQLRARSSHVMQQHVAPLRAQPRCWLSKWFHAT